MVESARSSIAFGESKFDADGAMGEGELLAPFRANGPDADPGFPSVQSISLTGGTLVSQSFDFDVVFDVDVTGVDLDDFGLVTTETLAASLQTVTGTGSQYSVSGNVFGGTGTLTLLLLDDDSIVDTSLNPLGGAGDGNGSSSSLSVAGSFAWDGLTINVVDDSVVESAGLSATDIVVTRAGDTSSEVTVQLSSSDNTELSVPVSATIPAGQASVTVAADAVDDLDLDGTQSVTVVGSMPVDLIAGLDDSFGTGGIATTSLATRTQPPTGAIAIQGDGKVVAATEDNTLFQFSVTRLLPNGQADPGFGTAGLASITMPNRNPVPRSMVIQPDGKIVVGGLYGFGVAAPFLARFNADGTPDLSYGTNGVADLAGISGSYVTDMQLTPDGKVLASLGISGSVQLKALRVTESGQRDSSFGSAGILTYGLINQAGTAVKVMPDGSFYLVGGSLGDLSVVKASADGTLDSTFGTAGIAALDFVEDVQAHTIRMDSQDRIVLGGNTTSPSSDFAAIRLLSDGSLDTSFGNGGLALGDVFENQTDVSSSMWVDSADRIVMAGHTIGSGGNSVIVARFDEAGQFDSEFTGDGSLDYQASGYDLRRAYDSALQPNGRLVVLSGWFDDVRVSRLNLGHGSVLGTDSVDVLDDEFPSVVRLQGPDFHIGTGQLTYEIDFDTPVTGLDASDFDLLLSGVSGASIAGISPSGASDTFVITVETGTGDGTLQLVFDDDDSVLDAWGKPVGGAGVDNGDFADSTIVEVERNPLRDVVGVVFDDVNNNGVRDPGEVGAENAGVFLDFDQDGFRDANEPEIRTPYDDPNTTEVDEGGAFAFTDVALGTFDIGVQDFWFSFLSSPDHPVTAQLEFTDDPLTIDIPATRNSTAIRGVAYHDVNANGVRDTGEPGIVGHRFYRDSNGNDVYNSPETNVLTRDDDPATPEDETGWYQISPVPFSWDPTNTFWYRAELVDAWVPTTDVEAVRTWTTPDQVEVFDVGFVENQASISGTVFDDVNGNGVQDPGDNPVSGWTVFLDTNGDGVPSPGEATTVTLEDDLGTPENETGTYRFDQVGLGYQLVRIEQRDGYLSTSSSAVLVELTDRFDQEVVDFAIHENMTQITGVVFEDTDGDGIQGPGELGIESATVFVDADQDGRLDPGEQFTLSDENGSYLLDDVIPGQSVVRVLPPIDSLITQPSVAKDQVFVMHGSDRISEIDPATGAALRTKFLGGPYAQYTNDSALAFDGQWLYASGYMPNQQPAVIVIDPISMDTIEQFPSGAGGITGSAADGAAVIGNRLYFVNAADNLIDVIDLSSRSWVASMSIPTINASGGFSSAELDLQSAFGESVDGTELVIDNAAGQLLSINPNSGVITGSVPLPPGASRETGLAGTVGEMFLSFGSPATVATLDASGVVLQSSTLAFRNESVAAGEFVDHAYYLAPLLDQVLTGNDFGLQPLIRTVSGVQYHDLNENDVFDAGEPPIEGVTIYADLNNNGLLDVDEPSTISGADGSYVLEDVPQSQVWIRRQWGELWRPTSFSSVNDLFIAPVDVPDVTSSTGESLLIRHFDPQTGASLGQIQTTHPVTNPNATTVDEDFIYTVDNVRDVLMQLTHQGGLVREVPIPPLSTGGIPYSQGPVVIGGTVYWITGGEFKIHTFDPITGNITNSRPIIVSADLIATLPSIPPSGNVVESPDGESIWLFANQGDRVFVVDPGTAEIVEIFNFPDSNGVNWSMATFKGEFFLRNGVTNGQTYVYDQSLNFVRSLGNTPAPGFGIATVYESGVRLTTAADVMLDQGYESLAGTISGFIGNDVNGNGVIDVGETPIEGATVFIDLNGNDWPDIGELTTTSGADGAYSFPALPPGEYTVSTLMPAGYRASTAYTSDGRLFAADLYADNQSPTGYYAEFWEIDPITGSVLQRVFTDIPLRTGAIGLAFDGQRLLLVDEYHDIIYQMTTDGQMIDSLPLGEGYINATNGQLEFTPELDYGPAVINGTIYTVRTGLGGHLQLTRFDADANEFVSERPLTYDYGLTQMPVSYVPSAPVAFRSVSASIDGNSIIVGTEDDRVITIDPHTGIASFFPAPITPEQITDLGRATLGGEEFISTFGGQIHVFGTGPEPDRILSGYHTLYGLAAGEHRPARSVLSVAAGETGRVDVALQSTATSIQGTIINDVDGDRMVDAGETPVEGVTVFLDLNDDGIADGNEPTAVTDALGQYTFSEVVPGRYSVGVVPPSDSVVHAWADDTTVAFAYFKTLGEDAKIQQIDTRTGQILNEFLSPYPEESAIGLAMDNGHLYLSRSTEILILDPSDGTVVDQIPIPFGSQDALAIVGDQAFVVDSGRDLIHIVDLIRRRVVDTWDLGLINNVGSGFYDLGLGLAEMPGGQNLAARLANGDVAIIDSSNGMVVETFSSLFLNAGAGDGREWIETGGYIANDLVAYHVRDALGLLTRIIPASGIGFVYGIGAESESARFHEITVYSGNPLVGVDFGVLSNSQTISGVQFVDENEDGIAQAGEPRLEGVTVFVDLDGNGFLDPDEPFDVSNPAGEYSISDVPYGGFVVDTVPVVGYLQSTGAVSDEQMTGIRRVDGPGGPSDPEYLLQLRYFDNAGSLVGSKTTSVEVLYPDSSTQFDNRILVVDNGLDKLIQLALDGTLISETPLPTNSSGSPLYVSGLAVIDQTVYLVASSPNQLIRFDPYAQHFYGATSITMPDDPPLGLAVSPPFSPVVTESVDGQSIVVFSRNDDRAFLINPLDARVTDVFQVEDTGGWDYAAATFGGQYHILAQQTSGRINQYDDQFNLVSDTVVNPGLSGLSGGTHTPTGAIVHFEPGIPLSQDFAFQDSRSTIAGRVSQDINGNGSFDGGEEVADAVVFVDANRNGLLDPAETSTHTDGSGEYRFEGLLPGDHEIRVVHAGRVETQQSETRLFTLEVDQGISTIFRMDPYSGQTLSSFPAPGVSSLNAGLAVDDDWLYYSEEDGVWILDPITGQSLRFLDLPDGSNTGIAALDGDLFVLHHDVGQISRIAISTGQVIETLDINAINGTNHEFRWGLGKSLDETRLYVLVNSDQALLIDPETGIAELVENAAYGAGGISAAGGELFGAVPGRILIQTEQRVTLRTLEVSFTGSGVGAHFGDSPSYLLRTAMNVDFVDKDFVLGDVAPLPPDDPTDIELSSLSIDENTDTSNADVLFASLSALDLSPVDTHTFELVTGDGDADNGNFIISGDALMIRQSMVLDHESQDEMAIRLRVTDGSGASFEKAIVLSVNNLVEVGKEDVTVAGGSQQRSMVDSLTIQFDAEVQIEEGAFQVQHLGDDESVDVDFQTSLDGDGHTVVQLLFDGAYFQGGSLIEGNYRLTIDGSKIQSTEGHGFDSNGDGIVGDQLLFGDTTTDRFFRLYGDSDGDRDVDGLDLGAFGQAFLKTIGQDGYNPAVDYDSDGDIDGLDLGAFGQSFLKTI